MKRLLLISISILFLNNTYSQDLPRWMQKSGWVTFSEVCESMKAYGGEWEEMDCSEGSPVTDKSTLLNAIYWAGEVVELYYDKSSNSFTSYKVRITWNTPRSKYYCGQIIKKKIDDLKEFTHRSLALKKCE